MLHIILLLLPGVLTKDWTVSNSGSICGVRGSNVTINCTFTFPKNQYIIVRNVSWCSSKENPMCDKKGPYVYNSSNKINQTDFQYTGNKISTCSLLISNFNSSRSGVYLFRFITNVTEGCYTSNLGTNVTFTDLGVFMTWLKEDKNITVGDSLNLTCKSISCPVNLPELQWFKDNVPIQHSDPILTFSSVTSKDSGNYSCALKNFKSSESEQIRLYVEETDTTFWIMIIGVSIISIIIIIAAVLILITRRPKTQGTRNEAEITKTADDVLQDEEVQYARISIKPKELMPNIEDQQDEESTIYSAVRVPEV